MNLTSSWCAPGGYVRKAYDVGELDLIAVYCHGLDKSYLLSAAPLAGRRGIWLRLSPPLNRQQACINLADDFEFAGAVAQLEERRRGTPKAGGSSPPSSTQDDEAQQVVVGAHQFRNHFGYYLERAAAGDEIRVTRRGRPHVQLLAA